MHTYEARWDPNNRPRRFPTSRRASSTNTLDVVAVAEQMLLIGRATWPEVWHLDDEGRVKCSQSASSCDSIRRWADDLTTLVFTRRPPQFRRPDCPNRWLIIESRPVGLFFIPTIDEGDVRQFQLVRSALAAGGITLLDTMIFDDQFHWWSLHELTTGTTEW